MAFLAIRAADAGAQTIDPDPGRSVPCNQSTITGFAAWTVPGISEQTRSDPELAVGVCHLVVISNQGIKGYNKAGVLGALDRPLYEVGGLWPPLQAISNIAFDPHVIYDGTTERFWAVAQEFTQIQPGIFVNRWLLAVSRGSDPNAGGGNEWNLFHIEIPEQFREQADFPGIAVSDTHVYLSMNAAIGVGWQVAVLEKSGLLPSQAPRVIETSEYLHLASNDWWTALAVKYPPFDTSPQYKIADLRMSGQAPPWSGLALYAIRHPPTVDPPEFLKFVMPLPQEARYGLPILAPQPEGSLVKIRTNDFGFSNALYRGDFLWAAHTVTPGDTDTRTVIRWYQIRMNGWGTTPLLPVPTLENWGELGTSASQYSCYPSIAVDSLGNAVITFTVVGTSDYLSIWRAVKCVGQSQFGAPELVRAGTALYEPPGGIPAGTKWSDFSGTDPDPTAAFRFFSHNQVAVIPNPTYDTWVTRAEVCSMDVNGDGATDVLDFGAFTNLYAVSSPAADYRNDGSVNMTDLTSFLIDLCGP